MNQKEFKRRIAFEVLVILGMLTLLTFICRIWPIIFLFLLGIFAAAIRLLFLSSKRVEIIEPQEVLDEPIKEPTDQDVKAMAYAVIVRRITGLILSEYPEARWAWENPNSKKSIESGESVFILLNHAGGYRRAQVNIHNLEVTGIRFCTTEKQEEIMSSAEDDAEDEEKSISEADNAQQTEILPQNYGLLAFEWSEAHMVELNARCNEAIACKERCVFLDADELPEKESWQDICNELTRAGLEHVTCLEEGIQINLRQ